MPYRKTPLIAGSLYHIYTRSIAEFHIFRSKEDYSRMIETLQYYSAVKTDCRFSFLKDMSSETREMKINEIRQSDKLVHIISYCLMPTHVHLVLEQSKEDGISKYMNLILKSYSKYFNCKYNRMGPLWQSRFKNVLVDSDNQLLHLTRYLHLNPVTSFIKEKPEEWNYSSYPEYLQSVHPSNRICDYKEYISMKPKEYAKFVCDNIDYQRELGRIKHLVLEPNPPPSNPH